MSMHRARGRRDARLLHHGVLDSPPRTSPRNRCEQHRETEPERTPSSIADRRRSGTGDQLPCAEGGKGIRVNGVAPGPVWTPLQISGGASPDKYQHFGSTTVFGRPGQPAELASIYVQLAASDASFATGNIYGASGGQGQP